jgi:hypothetical protein
MNARIRELAEQAVKAVDNPFPGNPLNDELEKMYIPDCFAEKFSKLIVMECSSICYKTFNNGDEIAGLLMQSFGVEE